jgi:pyruvate-formate lyase-activating enzyme
MGVYHITYSSKLNEICFFFDKECNFTCRGCITRFVPADYHLHEPLKQERRKAISVEDAISIVERHSFNRVIYLGFEPTVDPDFFLLARKMKKLFLVSNVLITNGYNYVEEEIIDEVCVSVKAVSRKLFEDFTGQKDPQRVLDNLKRYDKHPGRMVRTESIFIPGYIDVEEIENIARSIAAVDRNIPYRIDAYIPIEKGSVKFTGFRAPTIEELSVAKKVAQRHLNTVSILHSGRRGTGDVKRLY